MLHRSDLLVALAETPTEYPCLPWRGHWYVPAKAKQGYRDILLHAKGEVHKIVRRLVSRVRIGPQEG